MPDLWRFVPVLNVVIQDTSMRPALEPGDRVLVGRWLRVRPGDLVLVRDPERASQFLVKRVREHTPAGFNVAGDNPNVSRDSRTFGPIPRGLILGRVFWRYLPRERRGRG